MHFKEPIWFKERIPYKDSLLSQHMMDLDDGLYVALTFNETNDRSANGWDNQQIQHFPAYKM